MCEATKSASVQPSSHDHHSNRPEDQERVDDEKLKPILPDRRSKRNRVIYKSASNPAFQLPIRSYTVTFKRDCDIDKDDKSAGKRDDGGKNGMKYPPELRRHKTYL